MGHVFTYHDARIYNQWLKQPKNRSFTDLENHLMLKLLKPMPGETILDIGCGTGEGLLSLLESGLQVSGLDASPHMLEIAFRNLRNQADLHRGRAEELPFDDNAFSYACIINTLEFVDDPRKALEEAFRVAKDRVFIGIINRHSARTFGLRVGRRFVRSIYNEANFLSIRELKGLVRSLAGNFPIRWRTAWLCPRPFGRFFRKPEYFEMIYKYPVGPFTGMVVSLMPRFRVRPLELKKTGKPASGTLTGLAKTSTEAGKWKHICMKNRKTGRSDATCAATDAGSGPENGVSAMSVKTGTAL